MNEPRPLHAGAEVMLVVLTLSALTGMGRLLAGAWVWPLVASACAAHLVTALLRRRGLGLVASGALTALAAVAVVVWFGYPGTTSYGLPTGATWSAVDSHLGVAWEVFGDERAPVPAEPGFLVVASLALWFVAFVSDWAAFRLRVPFEAVLPAGTLFVFTSLLGAPEQRMLHAGLFGAAVLLFMLAHRVDRQARTGHWVGGRTTAGQRRLLATGGSLAVLAIIGGLVIGPQLPGAEAEALVDYRGSLSGPESRVTVSPLVDIRTRLVRQQAVEVFTVRSTERAYWRLTSLEEFDGRIWRSSGSFGRAAGGLPRRFEAPEDVATVDQSFSITNLAMLWLPAAFEPRSLDAGEAPIRYDEWSGTLIVDRELDASDGLTYTVRSESPRFDPAALQSAPASSVAADVAERYLELPADFPQSVRDLAAAVTSDARTPYEQALALQDHLRGFAYDLDVGPGHDDAALERFLFDEQRGYCEQFAGAYAAMARTVGLPSRVAVGFTPGEADPDDPQLFRVRGEHAHAWPEVYLPGAGWVPFEPTPGRGIPAGELHTGVPEQQADEPFGPPTGEGPSTPTTEAPGGPGGTQPPPGSGLETGELPLPPELDAGPAGDGDPGEGSGASRYLVGPVRTAAPAAAGLALAYLLAVPAALLAWRIVRRRRAVTPAAKVRLAWYEAEADASALAGYRAAPSETIAERARRLGQALPDAAADAEVLRRWAEVVEYAPGGPDGDAAAQALDAARRVARVAEERAGRAARVRRWFDPRPLVRAAGWGRGVGLRRVTQGARPLALGTSEGR